MDIDSPGSLLIVGGGNIAQALLSGWVKAGLATSKISVIDRNKEKRANLCSMFGVEAYESLKAYRAQNFSAPSIIFLCVKPQQISSVITEIPNCFFESLFVSVLAGVTLQNFSDLLPKSRVIRVMPNTPARISQGVNVCVGNALCNAVDKETVSSLLQKTGSVHWLEDESLMDAVTALAGSGPAYVFYFIEALIEAGTRVGLDTSLATPLAIETTLGAAMLAHSSKEDVHRLRENVSSKKGTTAAALDILLNNDSWKNILCAAISSATHRSEELSNIVTSKQ